MPQPISLKTKIVTDRFEESRDWYVDLLGLVVAEQWDEPGDRGCILAFGYAPGEALLEIYHGAAAASHDGIGLQFRVPDIDAIEIPDEERFRVRGPLNRPWGSRYLFLTDPNGISVVIFSGTSL